MNWEIYLQWFAAVAFGGLFFVGLLRFLRVDEWLARRTLK